MFPKAGASVNLTRLGHVQGLGTLPSRLLVSRRTPRCRPRRRRGFRRRRGPPGVFHAGKMCNKNKQLFLLGLVASGLAGDCNKNNHCSSGEFCYSSANSCSNRNCDCHACDDYNGAPGFTSGTQNCQRYENICGGDCTASAPAPTRRPTPRPVAATPRPTAFDGTFDDSTIKTAVAAWLADATAAEATYGHISTWDTSRVTDM